MKQHAHPSVQRGATLVMGLLFMTLLMLTVTIAFRMSNTNLKAVGNMQSQVEAESSAARAIERVISSDAVFVAPAATNFAQDEYGVTVNVATPVCTRKTPVYVASTGDPNPAFYIEGRPYTMTGYLDTHWDIAATATGGTTGARVEMHQGVRLIMPDDPNPCP